jgi:hypothetical protein
MVFSLISKVDYDDGSKDQIRQVEEEMNSYVCNHGSKESYDRIITVC